MAYQRTSDEQDFQIRCRCRRASNAFSPNANYHYYDREEFPDFGRYGVRNRHVPAGIVNGHGGRRVRHGRAVAPAPGWEQQRVVAARAGGGGGSNPHGRISQNNDGYGVRNRQVPIAIYSDDGFDRRRRGHGMAVGSRLNHERGFGNSPNNYQRNRQMHVGDGHRRGRGVAVGSRPMHERGGTGVRGCENFRQVWIGNSPNNYGRVRSRQVPLDISFDDGSNGGYGGRETVLGPILNHIVGVCNGRNQRIIQEPVPYGFVSGPGFVDFSVSFSFGFGSVRFRAVANCRVRADGGDRHIQVQAMDFSQQRW